MSAWSFTSESVTEGHPDKVADAISDSILDAVLVLEPTAKVACEVLVTKRLAVIAGEIGGLPRDRWPDIESIVRETVSAIGYDGFDADFDGSTIEVMDRINVQSSDIAQGVDRNAGAGDQGLMFGFAVEEAQEMMPLPIYMAHRLAERLAEVRKTGKVDYLRPDGKTQVRVRYEGYFPVAVEKVLISCHHNENVTSAEIKEEIFDVVVAPVIPSAWLPDGPPEFVFNPSGQFTIGGPVADTGLTGRKVIVDTYGGYARHGGGAFSGKDATKVDRSAAYAARWAAKNLIEAGAAQKLEIQLSYAIGDPMPFSTHIETFGTERVSRERIESAVSEIFDFRPASIIEALELTKPGFVRTTAYGHFGRPEFSWESLDRVDDIKSALGL
ncbi:MAG TPA: methionine adenosyltransferase [Acidimicrobiia bacterium]|nr:methionine adenosyltransferase [Acidimicrobiia bacterium]